LSLHPVWKNCRKEKERTRTLSFVQYTKLNIFGLNLLNLWNKGLIEEKISAQIEEKVGIQQKSNPLKNQLLG
jgi:hypothetical protein